MGTQTGKTLITRAKVAASRCRTAREKELYWKERRRKWKADALTAIAKLNREDRLLYSEQITKITGTL